MLEVGNRGCPADSRIGNAMQTPAVLVITA